MQSNNDTQGSIITQVREQWNGVIQTVVAACKGNADATNLLAPFLSEMEQRGEWRALIGVLRRILAGERDALALLRELDETDTVVAGDVLERLTEDGGRRTEENSLIVGQAERSAVAPEDDDDGKMISLEQFLQQVVRACRSNAPAGLAEQMHTATRGMATQPNLQPELRELGCVLNQILSGDRNPDLSVLHPQLREVVRKMLQELG